ncbi:uncharacterized protein OCT59_022543 [Rhizophagus irregularis]|uniref:uncharacterized protein n=1 Tax=Rhizophagus irregularis TaxID=588596 RepID=UPI00331E9200|nr:hypothetical protein OCT59_022543 [Rhizophagus irregularis]
MALLTYFYYRVSPHHTDRKHTSKNAKNELGGRKPSLKLASRETDSLIPVKLNRLRISDPNDHFVWGDLLDMYNSCKKYSRVEVYEANQATVACIQKGDITTWVFKSSENGIDLMTILKTS